MNEYIIHLDWNKEELVNINRFLIKVEILNYLLLHACGSIFLMSYHEEIFNMQYEKQYSSNNLDINMEKDVSNPAIS